MYIFVVTLFMHSEYWEVWLPEKDCCERTQFCILSLVVLNCKRHEIKFKMPSRQQSDCLLYHKIELMNCHKCVAVSILLSLQECTGPVRTVGTTSNW